MVVGAVLALSAGEWWCEGALERGARKKDRRVVGRERKVERGSEVA